MADELTPPSPPTPDPGAVTPDGGAPAPTPGAGGGDEVRQKLQALEAELTAERARRGQLEETLTALRPQPSAPGPSRTIAPPSKEQVDLICEASGMTPDEARRWWPAMVAYFSAIAQPVLHGLNGLADTVDLVQTRQEVKDYETIAEEAERTRKEHVQRGEFITRKQAVALVKARRAEDPAYLDRLVQERARLAQEREAAAASAVTERGGGTGGAGATRAGRPLTTDEFAKLPVAEQEKLLSNVPI